jgi:hypothetical protein
VLASELILVLGSNFTALVSGTEKELSLIGFDHFFHFFSLTGLSEI